MEESAAHALHDVGPKDAARRVEQTRVVTDAAALAEREVTRFARERPPRCGAN